MMADLTASEKHIQIGWQDRHVGMLKHVGGWPRPGGRVKLCELSSQAFFVPASPPVV